MVVDLSMLNESNGTVTEFTYTSPPRPRKKPLKAALLLEELSETLDGKWHTDGHVCVRTPAPTTPVRGNRNGQVEAFIRRTARAANKEQRSARILAEFTDPRERDNLGDLLILQSHYETGPILVSRAKFDYIMALFPDAEILTERRSTFVAFLYKKRIVGFLADTYYEDPGELCSAMRLALNS